MNTTRLFTHPDERSPHGTYHFSQTAGGDTAISFEVDLPGHVHGMTLHGANTLHARKVSRRGATIFAWFNSNDLLGEPYNAILYTEDGPALLALPVEFDLDPTSAVVHRRPAAFQSPSADTKKSAAAPETRNQADQESPVQFPDLSDPAQQSPSRPGGSLGRSKSKQAQQPSYTQQVEPRKDLEGSQDNNSDLILAIKKLSHEVGTIREQVREDIRFEVARTRHELDERLDSLRKQMDDLGDLDVQLHDQDGSGGSDAPGAAEPVMTLARELKKSEASLTLTVPNDAPYTRPEGGAKVSNVDHYEVLKKVGSGYQALPSHRDIKDVAVGAGATRGIKRAVPYSDLGDPGDTVYVQMRAKIENPAGVRLAAREVQIDIPV